MASQLNASSRFYDNSMLSGYKGCPRYYQLRYKLHWRSAGTAMPLVFGLAWHAGQDVIWKFGKQDIDPQQLAQAALGGFEKSWLESGMKPQEELEFEDIDRMGARTPMVAYDMYRAYVKNRWAMIREAELLACEQPFAVPLPDMEDVWYAGRLDKVVKFKGDKLVLEHKTTTEYKKDGGFRATYVSSWMNDSQCKGYQFGGSLYYEGLSQVWVDAALVHKQVHDAFRFIPIAHQFPLLAEWVGDTARWIVRLELDDKAGYFPKNEGSCIGKYGACTFLNICRTTADPSALREVPEGYMVEEWRPFDILKLDQLLKKEGENETSQASA